MLGGRHSLGCYCCTATAAQTRDTALNGYSKKYCSRWEKYLEIYHIGTVSILLEYNQLDGLTEEMDEYQNSTCPGALVLRCQKYFSQALF
jgi:hypothetical protein